ncbi:hypothetical protein BC828DRAFT_240034 [Blastocladiella britannica]|nr:hypothetical protein BC828DRAFT_240034 [Blastocladiella britannica]
MCRWVTRCILVQEHRLWNSFLKCRHHFALGYSSSSIHSPEGSFSSYIKSTHIAQMSDALLLSRLEMLAQTAKTHMPTVVGSVLPFVVPWILLMPVIATIRSATVAGNAAAAVPSPGVSQPGGAGDPGTPFSSSKSSSNSATTTGMSPEEAEWTMLVLACTVAFFISMAVGPWYIHRTLMKRHLAIRVLLDNFTAQDAYASDRHLVWRIATSLDAVQAGAGMSITSFEGDLAANEWDFECYETAIKIIVLGSSDVLDEHGTILALDALFGATGDGSRQVGSPGSPTDAPPVYTVELGPEDLEKPPDYCLMPATLFDADYELHASGSSSSGANNHLGDGFAVHARGHPSRRSSALSGAGAAESGTAASQPTEDHRASSDFCEVDMRGVVVAMAAEARTRSGTPAAAVTPISSPLPRMLPPSSAMVIGPLANPELPPPPRRSSSFSNPIANINGALITSGHSTVLDDGGAVHRDS